MNNRLLDNIIRMNMRSRYLVELYEEKKREGISLSSEEIDDYIAQNAMLDTTADLIYIFFSKIFPSIPFENLSQEGLTILEMCQKSDKFVYNRQEKRGLEEIFSDDYQKSNNYGQRTFDFGKRNTSYDLSALRNVIPSYESYKLNQYDHNCEHTYEKLLGCSKKMAHEELLAHVIKEYLELPIETRVADMNKIFTCWNLHSTMRKGKSVIVDKEYSTMKWPEDNFKNCFDYSELLASVGIEMGEMPKTFTSEIYRQSHKHKI